MDRPNQKRRLDRLSRRLVKTLRHTALEMGLSVGKDGFVSVTELRSFPQFSSMSDDDLRTVVRTCPKQRLGLKEDDSGELFVRANQGHSIAAVGGEGLLHSIDSAEEAPVAVHGTTYVAWELIRRSGGLSRMGRTHVHFASGEPGADGMISGMRGSSEVLCFLDVPAALAESVPLFLSENGVILSPGIPVEIGQEKQGEEDGQRDLVPLRLLRVIDRKTREVLWSPPSELETYESVIGDPSIDEGDANTVGEVPDPQLDYQKAPS